MIEGGVCVDFEPGQREATVHVSFCPPFQNIPDIKLENLDGAELETRVAARFLFGARLTVRRPAGVELSSSTLSYRIGFVATAAGLRRAA